MSADGRKKLTALIIYAFLHCTRGAAWFDDVYNVIYSRPKAFFGYHGQANIRRMAYRPACQNKPPPQYQHVFDQYFQGQRLCCAWCFNVSEYRKGSSSAVVPDWGEPSRGRYTIPERRSLSSTFYKLRNLSRKAISLYHPHLYRHRKVAYTTVAVGDAVVPGVLMLIRSIRMSCSILDIVVIAVELSELSMRALKASGARVIEYIKLEGAGPCSITTGHQEKVHIWSLVEYSEVIYLDADTVVANNIDFLFTTPGNHFVRSGKGRPQLFSSMMKVKTDLGVYTAFLAMLFTYQWTRGCDSGQRYGCGDVVFLNFAFKALNLSAGFFPTMRKSSPPPYHPLHYQVAFAKEKLSLSVLNYSFVVHFIAFPKPWVLDEKKIDSEEITNPRVTAWWVLFKRFQRIDIAQQCYPGGPLAVGPVANKGSSDIEMIIEAKVANAVQKLMQPNTTTARRVS